jgi:holo-[acyl-carrier protein] synthase
MIIGIGTDLVAIERIRRSLRRFGQDWINQVFAPEEQLLRPNCADEAPFFSRGFCGKEACSKALGRGFTDGISWTNIIVLQQRNNTILEVRGPALSWLNVLSPPMHKAVLSISAVSNGVVSQAMVVISTESAAYI